MKEKGKPPVPIPLPKTDTPPDIHILTMILEWNLIFLNMCPFKETGLGHRRVTKRYVFLLLGEDSSGHGDRYRNHLDIINKKWFTRVSGYLISEPFPKSTPVLIVWFSKVFLKLTLPSFFPNI